MLLSTARYRGACKKSENKNRAHHSRSPSVGNNTRLHAWSHSEHPGRLWSNAFYCNVATITGSSQDGKGNILGIKHILFHSQNHSKRKPFSIMVHRWEINIQWLPCGPARMRWDWNEHVCLSNEAQDTETVQVICAKKGFGFCVCWYIWELNSTSQSRSV